MKRQHIHITQESIMRKLRRRRRKKRAKNKSFKIRLQTSRNRKWTSYDRPIEVVAPAYFNLNNIEKVVRFVNHTEVKCNETRAKVLKVNLDSVEDIDFYAISLMLSMLNRLSHKNISYWGTYPDIKTAREFILESGFLDVMKSNIRKPANTRRKNQIFMVGKDSVDSHRIGRAVRESINFITGKDEPYPPVYDNMLEICANSVEHANVHTYDKNWFVSISFDDDIVRYIITDTGFGILNTLKKKKIQKFNELVTSKTDAEILCDVFHKVYQSVTGEINRHKGLPIVLESFVEGYISNLMVLTNKVFYNFETKESIELKSGFKGVLYSWTVSYNNYNNWLNSL